MHADVIRNYWFSGYQKRIERIELPSDDPRLDNLTGDYQYTTGPHEDKDCPFKDSEYLPLVHINTF